MDLHASTRYQQNQTFAPQTQCKAQEYFILMLLTDLYLFIYLFYYLFIKFATVTQHGERG